VLRRVVGLLREQSAEDLDAVWLSRPRARGERPQDESELQLPGLLRDSFRSKRLTALELLWRATMAERATEYFSIRIADRARPSAAARSIHSSRPGSSRRPRGDEPAGGPACRAFREESARASAASQPRALLVKVDADDAHRPRRVPRVARDVLAAERPVQVVVLDDVAALCALAPRPAAALFADFGLSQAVSSGRHEWYHRRARRGPARTASSRTETRTSCSSVLGDAGQRRHRMIIGQRRRRLHGPANKQRAYRFALVSSPPRRSGRAASRAITQVRPRLGPETRAALLQRGAAGR
jgi:hypothetical protein